MLLLHGITIIDLSTNVPGPVATSRLQELGARVVKIEPPNGDLLAQVVPAWYSDLISGKKVVTLDLKSVDGQVSLAEYLDAADLLITSMRQGALERLGLTWDRLHARYARLCHVAIHGYPPPRSDAAGHDLTYQAATGLLDPPRLPRTLIADLLGAERVVSAALSTLYERERSGTATMASVILGEAASYAAAPLRHGVTTRGGWLGGGVARYGIYATADGWIALAALEPRLWDSVLHAIDRPDLAEMDEGPVREHLTAIFERRCSAEWAALAETHNLPLEVVRTE